MRIALAMTLDGMVRALRTRAHILAEHVEDDARRSEPRETLTRYDARDQEAETDHDRSRD